MALTPLNKNLIKAGVIILAVAVIVLIAYCAGRRDDTGPAIVIPPIDTNVFTNAINVLANNAANLNAQGNEKKTEVNTAKNSLANKRKETDNAKNSTNSALANADIVHNSNFAGTNVNVARNAQCEFNPASCQ